MLVIVAAVAADSHLFFSISTSTVLFSSFAFLFFNSLLDMVCILSESMCCVRIFFCMFCCKTEIKREKKVKWIKRAKTTNLYGCIQSAMYALEYKKTQRESERVMFDIVLHYQLLIVTWIFGRRRRKKKFVFSIVHRHTSFLLLSFYLNLMRWVHPMKGNKYQSLPPFPRMFT